MSLKDLVLKIQSTSNNNLMGPNHSSKWLNSVIIISVHVSYIFKHNSILIRCEIIRMLHTHMHSQASIAGFSRFGRKPRFTHKFTAIISREAALYPLYNADSVKAQLTFLIDDWLWYQLWRITFQKITHFRTIVILTRLIFLTFCT